MNRLKPKNNAKSKARGLLKPEEKKPWLTLALSALLALAAFSFGVGFGTQSSKLEKIGNQLDLVGENENAKEEILPPIETKPDRRWVILELEKRRLNFAHKVFSQTWQKAWTQTPNNPASVFSVTSQILDSFMLNKKLVFEKDSCPVAKYSLLLSDDQASVLAGRIVSRTCNKSDNNSQVVAEFSYSDPTIRGLKDEHQVKWEFQSSGLPQGAGRHLTLLNVRTKCIFRFSGLKINFMNCQDLGQSLDARFHMLLSVFTYDPAAPNLIAARGTQYKNLQSLCDSPDHCLEILVPQTGAIRIIHEKPSKPTALMLEKTPEKGVSENGEKNLIEKSNEKILDSETQQSPQGPPSFPNPPTR